MMEAFESFEHAGFRVELWPDWDGVASPAEFDNLGELVSFSSLWRAYAFGKDGQTPGRESTGQEDAAYERGGWRLLERYLLTACGYVCAVPFSFDDYGSGGQRLREASTGDGREYVAGFIATTADRVEELGAPLEDVPRQLRGELAEWDAYVAGEVVGVVVRDPESGEVLESCWGFYPDLSEAGDGHDYARDEGRGMAEAERDERAERARTVAAGWARAHAAPRLEYLRGQIRAERISYAELAELQGLAAHIAPGDVELLEWAGVPEEGVTA